VGYGHRQPRGAAIPGAVTRRSDQQRTNSGAPRLGGYRETLEFGNPIADVPRGGSRLDPHQRVADRLGIVLGDQQPRVTFAKPVFVLPAAPSS
jgi:hypothetical protein